MNNERAAACAHIPVPYAGVLRLDYVGVADLAGVRGLLSELQHLLDVQLHMIHCNVPIWNRTTESVLHDQ